MPHYLVCLELLGPLGTPLHSGTLFGHLCWARRELEGNESLMQWLKDLPGRPLLISDGFPSGWLPRPLLAPRPRAPLPDDPQRRRLAMDAAKRRRKARLMRVEDFLRLRAAVSPDLLDEAPGEYDQQYGLGGYLKRESLPHNRIDRRSGHTLEEGGLFFLQELWPHPEHNAWDVYVETDLAPDVLQRLFEHVGQCGYGRDATWGRGRFRARVSPADANLFDFQGGRLLSLSHGSLSGNMQQARYRLDPHYGKLGNVLARCDKPFKYPLLLLAPGATFEPRDDGPFGELLRDVHEGPPGACEIVHNAWHLALPYTESPPREAD